MGSGITVQSLEREGVSFLYKGSIFMQYVWKFCDRNSHALLEIFPKNFFFSWEITTNGNITMASKVKII
jgi:hypothetical protein